MLKLCIAFGVCAAFSGAGAQEAKKTDEPKNVQWFRAVVLTDGGTVYSAPDFDAPVVDYLAFKTPIVSSRKALPGQGGLGLFHRVRYKDKSGFMADTDLKILEKESAGAGGEKTTAGKKPQSKRARSKAFGEDEEVHKREPLYFSRQAGIALALVNFTEKFSGNRLKDNILMYGLRLTGPDILLGGPPIDFNFWFSLQKPGYYQDFSRSVEGFLLFGDIMAMLPLYEGKNSLVNYGIGWMWTYTNYRVNVKSTDIDSKEFRSGLDFMLGYAHRINTYVIRADVKYFYEKTQYFGYLLSFQSEF